jgi:hypothetical protein
MRRIATMLGFRRRENSDPSVAHAIAVMRSSGQRADQVNAELARYRGLEYPFKALIADLYTSGQLDRMSASDIDRMSGRGRKR